MSRSNRTRPRWRRGGGRRAGLEARAIISDALRFCVGAWLLYSQTQQKEIQWLWVLLALGLMGWLSAEKALSLLGLGDSTQQRVSSVPEDSQERGSQSSHSLSDDNNNEEENEREPA